jgi:hypothetical protein
MKDVEELESKHRKCSGILTFQSAIFICKTNMNQENWGIEPTIADMLIS